MEDYAGLRLQVIEFDDNNYPDPDNIPQTNNTTTNSETALNWNGEEFIVFPLLASNLPYTLASFKNYSHKDFMKMSNIDFLILFLLDYLKQVVIPQTNKKLK